MIKEDIDKTLSAIADGIEINNDIEKALEGDDHLSLLEGGTLFIKHAGKAFRFVKCLREIGNEIVDIDTDESDEVINALSEVYDPQNPLVKSGIRKIVLGAVNIKEGIRELSESNKNE